MFASKDTLLTRPSGYQIQRSLRFRSSASAYLNRTPTTASNRKTFTISAWVKRGIISDSNLSWLFTAGGNDETDIYFRTEDVLEFRQVTSASEAWKLSTTQVFRDPSAWYHFVFAFDTTQATASNRIKVYVNGVQITAFSTASYPAQNNDTYFNNNVAQYISKRASGTVYFDGYLTEINFIDGQALTPSSFGAINPVTGVWSATKYAGTYGTNGFYLNFTDNSAATATTIGKDNSGNGNNWTPNNISVTAGATYDSMQDVPTLTSATAANYCVMNPLNLPKGGTLSNGNLLWTSPSAEAQAVGTMYVSSGKFYWEMISNTSGGCGFGIASNTTDINNINLTAGSYVYYTNGNKYNGGTGSAYGATFTNGDLIGIALDLDAGTLVFYKNNTSQGTAFTGLSGTFTALIYEGTSASSLTFDANFGQRPFSYTPPTGFKALHTGNLAAPVIALPAQNMAATTYTGTGATQSISNAVNGVSMQPDWVWFKRRGAAENHWLTDSVRGSTKGLFSNLTDAEATRTDQLTSFNSNGFTLGADAAGYSNISGQSYIAWQWKAGGTAVSNTAGSITSSVSANTTAGFSVVTWAGIAGGQQTVGHGLGVAPVFIISKNRTDSATDWYTAAGFLSGWNWSSDYLRLNSTAAKATDGGGTVFPVAPTSTVFTVGDAATNGSGKNYVAYCFTPVAGYSAFGSYTGNGSADGPFVFLGFRPRWVMVKITNTTGNWLVWDSSRDASNVVDLNLRPNLSDAESSEDAMDFLSNGFKLRSTSGGWNGSGNTYIYACFAENPFKNSLAR